MIHYKCKQRPRSAIRQKSGNRIPIILLQTFLAGIASGLILLVIGAAVFAALPVPAAAVQPTACLIAGCSVAISGAVLAARIGHQRLLLGLGCGVFYAACLAIASAVTGNFAMTQSTLALLSLLICSGMFGGVLTALRTPQRMN